jgi:hypothetical protein
MVRGGRIVGDCDEGTAHSDRALAERQGLRMEEVCVHGAGAEAGDQRRQACQGRDSPQASAQRPPAYVRGLAAPRPAPHAFQCITPPTIASLWRANTPVSTLARRDAARFRHVGVTARPRSSFRYVRSERALGRTGTWWRPRRPETNPAVRATSARPAGRPPRGWPVAALARR